MALRADGEPIPTSRANGGADPGVSEPPTGAPACQQQSDTPCSSTRGNGEGSFSSPGEPLPQSETQGFGAIGPGVSSGIVGDAAATSHTNDGAGGTTGTTAVVPANTDAAPLAGNGCSGEDENKNTVGVDQANLESEGSSARSGNGHGVEGGVCIAASRPSSTSQESRHSCGAPVRMAWLVVLVYGC